MPKLNRIRIVNFKYNNSLRTIDDITLPLFDGESTLINLTNGGGKTVLIQLIMQAIVPNIELQKRKMSSFFKNSRNPAYVILEWILDNPDIKDYLMTGIAMSPAINTDNSISLDYFTFVNHYHKASDFDISTLPFSKVENGKRIVMSYENARDEVKNASKKYAEFFYYPQSDRSSYRKKLSEFHISQDEWRNIIAKMNESEGGIEGLFEQCSTSDQLINEWMIKTVEKKLLNYNSENTTIPELISSLIDNVRENADNIKTKEILSQYMAEHEKLERALNDVCTSIDEFENSQQRLRKFYSLLKCEYNNIDNALSEISEQMEELELEKNKILHEQKSEAYYNDSERLEEKSKIASSRRDELDAINHRLKSLCEERDIQTAARLYSEIQRLKGELNALKQQLSDMENPSDEKQIRLNNLKYSLKVKYTELYNEYQRRLEEYCNEMTQLESDLKAAENDIKHLEAEKETLSNRIAVLDNNITKFSETESKFEKKTGLALVRNILGELQKENVNNYIRDKELSVKSLPENIDKLNIRCTEIKRKQEALHDEFNSLTRLESEKEAELKSANDSYEKFIKAKNERVTIFEKYELDRNRVFDSEYCIGELLDRLNTLSDKRDSYTINKHYNQETLNAISGGYMFIPQNFKNFLTENNIQFKTGEDYLDELESQDRKMQMLSSNPLLPYGIIVDNEKIVRRIENLPWNDLMRQIVLIFTFDNLSSGTSEKPIPEEKNIFLMDNRGIHVIGSNSFTYFKDDERQKFKAKINADITRINEQLKNNKKDSEKTQSDLATLKRFEYNSQSETTLLKRISESEKELSVIRQKKENNEKQRNDLKNEAEKISQEIRAKEKQLEKDNQLLKQSKDFLIKNTEYENNCTELREKQKELCEVKAKIEQLEARKTSIDRKHDNIKTKKIDAQQKCNTYEEKKQKFSFAEEGSFIDDDTTILEQEYENLNHSVKSSRTSIEDSISEKTLSIAKKEKEISELELQNDSYKNVEYSEYKLDSLKSEIKQTEKDKETAENNFRTAEREQIRAERDTTNSLSALKEVGLDSPLPKSEILRDYDNRKQRIKSEEKALEKKKQDLISKQKDCTYCCDAVEGEIDINGEIPAIEVTLEDDFKSQYKKYQSELKAIRKAKEANCDAYSNIYNEISRAFFEKNRCIADILTSLKLLGNIADADYSTVYHQFEEFSKKKENLIKLIAAFNHQLENIERTKEQICSQCVSYAETIYNAFREISNMSKVKLNGKGRSTQLLKIKVPENIDVNSANARIRTYIEEKVSYFAKIETVDVKNYKSQINAAFSPRQLLNQFINNTKIDVDIYKIEITAENSRMKKWDEAMKENSGAEKFICFFVIVSTLINYSRKGIGDSVSDHSHSEGKVIIMDNPFGATSSEHILKAVMQVAETFSIQLICFSDHDQSNITNRFRLIYKLRVKNLLYTNKEILAVDKVMKSSEIEMNEKLEHSYIHQTYEQINLFDSF